MWQAILAGFLAEIAPAIGKAISAAVQAIIAAIFKKIAPTLPEPTGNTGADRLTLIDAAIAATKPRQVFVRAALRHMRAATVQANAEGRALTADDMADVTPLMRAATIHGE